MSVFEVWAPVNGNQSIFRNETPNFREDDAEHAAHGWVERHYYKLGCPEEVVVHVVDEKGILTRWKVYTERTLTFFANPIEEKPDAAKAKNQSLEEVPPAGGESPAAGQGA